MPMPLPASIESAIVAGAAGDVVDLDEQPRLVAAIEEARQAGGHHDRIADDHVLGGVADARSSSRPSTMTRTVPLKSGMSKVTVALPSASTLTMPE